MKVRQIIDGKSPELWLPILVIAVFAGLSVYYGFKQPTSAGAVSAGIPLALGLLVFVGAARQTKPFVSAIVVSTAIVVAGAVGLYLNLRSTDAVPRNLTARAETAYTLSNTLGVAIGSYTDNGLSVTLTNKTGDTQRARVVIEATTPGGDVIATEFAPARVGAAGPREIRMFDRVSPDVALLMPTAKFSVVYAETPDADRSTR